VGFVDLFIIHQLGGGTMELRCVKVRAQILVSATIAGLSAVFEFKKAPRFNHRLSDDIVRGGEPSD
jgi:hypothetical protein